MRHNPLSYENRFEPEPMKRYPRSRLVASLSAPPRQRAQEARMVESPHRFRVVVLEDNKTMCAVSDTRDGAHVELMRSLAKPGVVTLLTDLKNNNVSAEGLLHIYSAFTFVHRLGDFIGAFIFPMFGVEPYTHPTSVYDIFNERHSDAFVARSAEPQTVSAYYALSRAIGDSGVRALTSNDWKRHPDDPLSGRNILRRFIVTHTNSDMHRKGKVKPAFWSQSVADWVALSEMPSARARKGRGEPCLLYPPRPGEYDPEVEAVLAAYAEAVNTFFPAFAQAALTNLEGSVIDITVCAR